MQQIIWKRIEFSSYFFMKNFKKKPFITWVQDLSLKEQPDKK